MDKVITLTSDIKRKHFLDDERHYYTTTRWLFPGDWYDGGHASNSLSWMYMPCLTKALVLAIEAIPGVTGYEIYPYRVVVKKTMEQYTWKEIEPSVVSALVRYGQV